MDANRFDAMARSLAETLSRRRLTGQLGSLGLSAALGTLPRSETAAKRKKKRKKKKPRATAPPPPGRCPGGQKPCAGGCIPTAQCCNNADCTISGQVCLSGQCACPAALPETCGGACLAPCGPASVRNPATCTCCLRLDQDSVNNLECCSHVLVDLGGRTVCTGRDVGDPCELDDQCDKANCVAGKCAACAKNQDDFCLSHQATCSAGGQCLHALDGTSRCGVGSLSFTCDLCTDDIDCDQGTGSGRFCARSTGPNCPCPAGQTFCARLP